MRALATDAGAELRGFSPRQWLVAIAGAAVAGLAAGLPTDIVPNPFYRRMTPVLWWNYPVWAATAVLAGLLVATYVRRVPAGSTSTAFGGGLLSFFAVGCPICNKLVVALVGVSGALTLFVPIQPYMALAGLALLVFSLGLRFRGLARCSLLRAGPAV